MAIEKYGVKRLACPKCGQDNAFQVTSYGNITACLDGAGNIVAADGAPPQLTPNSACMCQQCRHVDLLKMFEMGI